MVRPLVLYHSVVEFLVVVGTGADVEDEVVVFMVLVEIGDDVVDGVPECFLEEIRSRISHSYDTVSNVGQI